NGSRRRIPGHADRRADFAGTAIAPNAALTSQSRTHAFVAVFLAVASLAGSSEAAPARPAPALPAPTGTVVNVSSESALRAAVSSLSSNTTIVLAPGIYTLRDTLYINGTFTNVGIRGATGEADQVVLAGPGMTNASVPFGIWVGGDVRGVTIANLTIRDIYYHPIMLNAGA